MSKSYNANTRIELLINAAWGVGIVVLVAVYMVFSSLVLETAEFRSDERVLSGLFFNFPIENMLTETSDLDGNFGISNIWLANFKFLNKNHEKLEGILGEDGYAVFSGNLKSVETNINKALETDGRPVDLIELSVRVRSSMAEARRMLRQRYFALHEEIETSEQNVQFLFYVLIGMFFVWIIASGVLVKRYILRPLRDIGSEIGKLGVDLSRRLPEPGVGELGQFCLAVNRMAVSLERTHASRVELEQEILRRMELEEHLRLSASVFTSAMEGIMITDKAGSIIDVNSSFSVITGYAREEVIGKNPRFLQSGFQDQSFYAEMWASIAEQGYWRGEIWNKRKNGEVFPELLTISAVQGDGNENTHFVGMFSDISRLKENETKLQHLAHYDALTGLPNQVLLGERIREKVEAAQGTDKRVAVGFIDLDKFRAVNETYGHETGDKLLIAVSERLARDLQDSDALARIGGDEFVVMLGEVADEEEARVVFERLLKRIQEPFTILGNMIDITSSIGIAFFDEAGDIDAGLLLRRADMAMYQAKLFGRNCCFYFNPEKDTEFQRNSAMVRDVENALANDEFVLYYQPKVDLRSGEILDVEALIRWHKPGGEIVFPGDFLPMIENDDVIIKIGERVIEKALQQLKVWHKNGIEYGISVNIAARQLQSPDFALRFEEMVANTPKMLVRKLEIEIVETTAIKASKIVIDQMLRLISLGVKFSLDDFGTGYSSLTYLRELPVSKIKIDQGFIRSVLKSKSDQKILYGAISLGKSFGLEVVAEGVETEAHGYWLLEHDCHLAQGYAICKPLPEGDFMTWRASWMADNPWKPTVEHASAG